MNKPNVNIPEDMMFLLTKKARHKVIFGGRYGYKSWSVAQALAARCWEKKTRVLCCRETLESLDDSVHQLLSDTLNRIGIKDEFKINNNEIINKHNGSNIIYDGLRNSRTTIKGKEEIDICWIEEAELLTEESWVKLWPTIRKANSEIWISFNTPAADDFVYENFVTNPPEDSIVHQTFWYNNPFINETIQKAILDCKKRDPEGYRHEFLGEPSKTGLRVYPFFDEKVHVKTMDFNYAVEHGNFFVGMDPHKTAFPAVVFGFKVPVNSEKTEFDYFVYNEYPSKSDLHSKLYYEVRKTAKCSHTMKQLTGMFKILETTCNNVQNSRVNVVQRACDPYFAKGVGGSDWSSDTDGLVKEWMRPENGGLFWTLPERDILTVQRNTINELMKFNDEMPISAINRPSFYVFPNCENLITSLKLHRDSSDKDCEDEKHKDFSDALRILMSVMHYTPYRENKKKVVVTNVMPLVNKSIFMHQTVSIN